jgi:hypothetical protein
MRRLSISQAWEESKARITSDSRLLVAVAAALFALPVAIGEVISPGGFDLMNSSSPEALLIVAVITILLLVGQLAIVRLAIGPSVSVGDAIAHGLRRLPAYFLSALIVVGFLMLILVLFGVVLAATGAPIENLEDQLSPSIAVVGLIFVVIYCFLWTRIIVVAAPVASAEAAGPIQILRRSWELTSGHFWRLFAFLLLFMIGAMIVVAAVQSVGGLIARLSLGPIQPFSFSALVVALLDAVANAAVITVMSVILARIYVQLSGRESLDVSVPNSGN